MKNLLTKSKKIKEDADRILNDSTLHEILKKYGEPKIVGSYSYNLMMNPDIDIHLYVKELSREKAVKLLNELIEQDYFDNYSLIDWVRNRDDRWSKGYYVGLKKIVSGHDKKWKIDIWQLVEDTPGSLEYQKLMKEKLNNKPRSLILELKELRNNKYPQLPSTIIYDSVLKEDIRNKEDFKNYLKKKDLFQSS